MIVALEGIQAAGKSTTASLLGKRFGAEVVNETTANHPFLDQVYDDAFRDDVTVELGFLVLHANAFRLIDRSQLTICDYSPVKDLLFAEDMLESAELSLFVRIYRHLYRAHGVPDLVIYLDVAPEVCMARVRRRREESLERDFEKGLTVERLERMRQRYRSRLDELGEEVVMLTLAGSEGPQEVANQVGQIVETRLAPTGAWRDDPSRQ